MHTLTLAQEEKHMEIGVGAIVKYRVEYDDEKGTRYTVIEDNGDRVIMEFICDMAIKPTFVARKCDIELA